jgi:hypothetical protein
MRKQLCVMFGFLFGSALVVAGGPTEARARHDQMAAHHQSAKQLARTEHARTGKYRTTRSAYGQRKFGHTAKHRTAKSRGVSLAGVTPVLAAKARQIVANCGSTIVSAVSRRGIRSNHPIGRAVDIKGNPGCVYAQLKGWPGGYSTDYAATGHVHISYNPGGQEWGLRFAHGAHGPGTRRYAGGHGANHGANHGAQRSAKTGAARYAMQSHVHVGAMHTPH